MKLPPSAPCEQHLGAPEIATDLQPIRFTPAAQAVLATTAALFTSPIPGDSLIASSAALQALLEEALALAQTLTPLAITEGTATHLDKTSGILRVGGDDAMAVALAEGAVVAANLLADPRTPNSAGAEIALGLDVAVRDLRGRGPYGLVAPVGAPLSVTLTPTARWCLGARLSAVLAQPALRSLAPVYRALNRADGAGALEALTRARILFHALAAALTASGPRDLDGYRSAAAFIEARGVAPGASSWSPEKRLLRAHLQQLNSIKRHPIPEVQAAFSEFLLAVGRATESETDLRLGLMSGGRCAVLEEGWGMEEDGEDPELMGATWLPTLARFAPANTDEAPTGQAPCKAGCAPSPPERA